MTSTFYMASAFVRQAESKAIVESLIETAKEADFELSCTSTWLTDARSNLAYGKDKKYAIEDIGDVQRADFMVQLAGDTPDNTTRGGRHTELGVALAGKKICFILTLNGTAEQVFHNHPNVLRYSSAAELIRGVITYLRLQHAKETK